jgi:hypothetical protein
MNYCDESIKTLAEVIAHYQLTFRTLKCHIDCKDIETLALQGFHDFIDKSLYRSYIINS